MHKVFFRNFFAIFALCLCITSVVMGFIFLNYNSGKNRWMDKAFEDFAENLEEEINRSESFDSIINIVDKAMRRAADDRISGYVISDSEGRSLISNGRNRMGKSLPVPDFSQTDKTSERTVRTIDLSIDGNVIKANLLSGKKNEELPKPIDVQSKEIIGTVMMDFDNSPAFYIDILTFTPTTYAPNKPLVEPILKSLWISLPMCMILSALGAWIISSKSTKFISKMRSALGRLANEEENVMTDNFSTLEYQDIANAVRSLDLDLQSNRRSRRAWLNSISHDLNTPVMAMKMLIDGMNDGVINLDAENIKSIQKENDNLADKISKVIYFSSIQAKSKIKTETVECQDFVSEIADSENIKVDLNVKSIKCNRELMQRAVSEIVENAKTFKTGEEPVTLSISAENGEFEIKVTNTGTLIHKDNIDYLFEPWTKGNEGRGFTGNGLGLPIVGTVARLHSGKASIMQEENYVVSVIRWKC